MKRLFNWEILIQIKKKNTGIRIPFQKSTLFNNLLNKLKFRIKLQLANK